MTLRSNWKSLVRRCVRIVSRVSIRTKILGIILSLMLVLGSAVTIQVRQIMKSNLRTQLQDHSRSLTGAIAAQAVDPVLINDLKLLDRLLFDTKANHPELEYAFIQDTEGHVLAHTFRGGFPLGLLEIDHLTPEGEPRAGWLSTNTGPVWDTGMPLLDGKAGQIRVGLSEVIIRELVSAATTRLLLTTLAIAMAGVLASVSLTWILTRPILSLVASAKAVGRGDFDQRVDRWPDDEIGELAQAFNSMTEELAQTEQARADRDRLQSELIGRVISAQEEERKRVARELHDETGQALTSIMIGLRNLQDECPKSAACVQAEQLRAVTAQALQDVHDLALELRPSVLDDLGLVVAVEHFAADLSQRSEIPIELAAIGLDTRRLPQTVEVALYRIIQEGVVNAVRHGEPSTISVLLEHRNGSVRILVEDDGCGFDVNVARATGRLGLFGMRERVDLLGGTLIIETKPARGTTIRVEIPLEQTNGNNTRGEESLPVSVHGD